MLDAPRIATGCERRRSDPRTQGQGRSGHKLTSWIPPASERWFKLLSEGFAMTQRRYELTDFEWSVVQPLLPNKPRSVPRADDRTVPNGIYWWLRTGSRWADIPNRFGPATICCSRFVRWRKLGVWDRIFAAVSAAYDGDIQMVDSSPVRVRQHAVNTKKVGSPRRGPPLGTNLTPDAWGAREADRPPRSTPWRMRTACRSVSSRPRDKPRTAAAPTTWSKRWAKVKSSWTIADTTATECA